MYMYKFVGFGQNFTQLLSLRMMTQSGVMTLTKVIYPMSRLHCMLCKKNWVVSFSIQMLYFVLMIFYIFMPPFEYAPL